MSSEFHKAASWHFSVWWQIQNHLCQISSGSCTPKIIKKSIHFWLSCSKNKMADIFVGHSVHQERSHNNLISVTSHKEPIYLTCYDNTQMYMLLYRIQDSWIFQILPKTCMKPYSLLPIKLKPSKVQWELSAMVSYQKYSHEKTIPSLHLTHPLHPWNRSLLPSYVQNLVD